MADRLFWIPVAIAAIAVSSLVAVTRVKAHTAPKGWSYDSFCCSNMDCREVPASYVKETAGGYQLTKTNEVIPYGSYKVKDSPDGLIHWCTHGGTDQGKTLCLYMPPRAY
jgi:hypothetical protein